LYHRISFYVAARECLLAGIGKSRITATDYLKKSARLSDLNNLGILNQGGGGPEMRACRSTVVLACALMNAGCMTTQLRNHMTEQASTIPNVYYQVVLDNLAMIAADPARMPYFSDPQTAQTSIAQNANVSYGINFDRIVTAPSLAAYTYLFGRTLLDKQTATLTGGQTNIGLWASVTANDPDKLFSMRAV
jgi:hypothetical protein